MRVAVLLLLASCDAVFGVTPPSTPDAPAPADAVDGPPGNGILNPPPGMPCGPTPTFESWAYELALFPSMVPVSAVAFYRTASEVRAVATSVTRDALYDVGPDTVPHPLPIAPPPNTTIYAASVDPAGEVIWFLQSGGGEGLYYATRASNWTKRIADLGFVDAEIVEPGAVGYFDGKARMVVTVRPFAGEPTLHEVESTDGLTWTPLATIQLGERTFHGHLSPDGCYLLFAKSTSFTEIHVSTRDETGAFSTSTRVVPTTLSTEVTRPALAPDESTLWFGCSGDLCRGTP